MASTAPTHPSAATGSAAGADERLPWPVVLAWGSPVFALAAQLFFVQFFFLKFATDVLLIAPITASAIFAIGRLWDAVSDPVVGTWSDRTRTRLGRRRPWMLAGIPLLVLSTLAVWSPPSLSTTGLIVWETAALLFFYTAFTCYMVPHLSLGAELTDDHHDRTRIFGVQSASFTLGMIFAFPATQIVTTAEDPRGMATLIAVGLVAAAGLLLMVPPLRVPERDEFQGRGSERPFRAMKDVLANVHAPRLLFVQFVQMLGLAMIGVLAPYQMQYVVQRPEWIAIAPATLIVCNIASIPVWTKLSRRYGKRRMWMTSMILAGFAFGGLVFVTAANASAVFVVMPLAGAAMGCGMVVGNSLLADVIDSDELETGERKEGAYSAAWGFALKLSNALVIVLVGVGLQSSGFTPNVAQSDATLLALRATFLVPFLAFLAAAWVLSGLRLDEAEHARIRAALDARAG